MLQIASALRNVTGQRATDRLPQPGGTAIPTCRYCEDRGASESVPGGNVCKTVEAPPILLSPANAGLRRGGGDR
jgi:hypothetical protein